jgi:hypothetical protein
MVQFAAVLLRGVIATFAGVLIAGGTLTLAADRAPVDRPSLVAVAPGPAMLTVPNVTGQAYVFAKGILQDHGFAWHVTGPVQGYAANTVFVQKPAPGSVVLDTGAPLVTLTLGRNPAYVEKGTPDNQAPYAGTALSIPANVPDRPKANIVPQLEPATAPSGSSGATLTIPVDVKPPTKTTTAATPAPAVTTPAAPATTPSPAATPSGGPRTPDFAVVGAPKEPSGSKSLPDRVAALATFVETHRSPSATNLNHWLYEHAYVIAGARFGWWHGAEALQALIEVDKRAEALWGVGGQSRTTAEKALAEVRARGG